MSDLNLIKELREKTGAGFLDCKNALSENDNNIEQSIDSIVKEREKLVYWAPFVYYR